MTAGLLCHCFRSSSRANCDPAGQNHWNRSKTHERAMGWRKLVKLGASGSATASGCPGWENLIRFLSQLPLQIQSWSVLLFVSFGKFWMILLEYFGTPFWNTPVTTSHVTSNKTHWWKSITGITSWYLKNFMSFYCYFGLMSVDSSSKSNPFPCVSWKRR